MDVIGLIHLSYADDIQLYMTMARSNNDSQDGLVSIELCVSEIRHRMKQNMLKLNDDRTELVVWLQKTQPIRGGAITVTWQTLCKVCLPRPPPAMGPRLPFLGKLDGWYCPS